MKWSWADDFTDSRKIASKWLFLNKIIVHKLLIGIEMQLIRKIIKKRKIKEEEGCKNEAPWIKRK